MPTLASKTWTVQKLHAAGHGAYAHSATFVQAGGRPSAIIVGVMTLRKQHACFCEGRARHV
jgi:hypothetical protein